MFGRVEAWRARYADAGMAMPSLEGIIYHLPAFKQAQF